MSDDHKIPSANGVSLVNGDAVVRHARQLMLRSEGYDVRSYATGTAMLSDPRSPDCACLVVDLQQDTGAGLELLRMLRATGWPGKALLLDGPAPTSTLLEEAERHGDMVLARTIGDGAMLIAIAATINHGWSGWDALD